MDKEAFADRIIEAQDMLYRVSYSLMQNPADQADAVQECLRRALQRRESLKQPEFLQTWLVRILINTCYDMLRKRGREIPSEDVPAVVAPRQSDAEVVEALAALDVRFRLPLVLHYIEGYTTREIARMLRIPEGTVKTRMARGRRHLAKQLEERGMGYEGA